MAVYNPPRTYTGKWFGTWFGGTAYNWFGPFPTGRGVIIERAACECCYGTCQCENCLNFGYWDEYDVTVPVPYGYYRYAEGAIGRSAGLAYFLYTGPRSFTTTTMTSTSNGWVNNCCFEYLDEDITFTYDTVDYTIHLLRIVYCPNAIINGNGDRDSSLTITVVESWIDVPTIRVSWTARFTYSGASDEEHCHDPPILTADDMDTGVFVPAQGQILNWYDGPPKTIEPEASGTATWRTCGTDEDGDPITDPGGPGAGPAANLFDTVSVGGNKLVVKKRTPLPKCRPNRCEHFGGRTEFKPGCNGFYCKGKCDLGLPAVPGEYCQTCEKYEPDPDYMGQGIPGWLK